MVISKKKGKTEQGGKKQKVYLIFPKANVLMFFQLLVMAMFLLVAALQTGCATMSSTPRPLKFDKFNFSTSCFSADDMEVIYGNRHIRNSKMINKLFPPSKMRPAKQPNDDKRLPRVHMGPKGYFEAFEDGPITVKWRSLDNTQHSIVLDLDEIFKDRIVRHTEDPKLVDHVNSRNPVIVVEVNNRTINLYMDVWVSLSRTETSKRISHRHRTLIYSKAM